MDKSHALSEKAVKKHGLENAHEEDKITDRTPVKEWNSYDAYWDDRMAELDDRNAKWYVKVKNFFKYSIGWRTRDWWINTKWYFRNLKTFKPILKTWRSFDYHYQIDLFKFGIKQLAKALDYYGSEEPVARNKRIAAMNELIKEIDRDYEKELEDKMNYHHPNRVRKVTKFADGSVLFDYEDDEAAEQQRKDFYEALAKERENHYKKIFYLIQGQDDEQIREEVEKRIAAMSEEEKQSLSKDGLYQQVYNQVQDGSGIESWWD